VRLALNYSQHIGEHSVFTQDFLVETGSDNTYTESSTGLKVSMMDNTALKLSFTAKRNSDIPTTNTDIEKTDTISAVTLVYSF
jgi:putative salt-induced outer membrane protein